MVILNCTSYSPGSTTSDNVETQPVNIMQVQVVDKSPQAPVSTESLSPDTRREQFQGCRPAEMPQGGEDVQKPSQDVAVAVAEKETKLKDLGI